MVAERPSMWLAVGRWWGRKAGSLSEVGWEEYRLAIVVPKEGRTVVTSGKMLSFLALKEGKQGVKLRFSYFSYKLYCNLHYISCSSYSISYFRDCCFIFFYLWKFHFNPETYISGRLSLFQEQHNHITSGWINDVNRWKLNV